MARDVSDRAARFEQLYDHRFDSAERAEKARLWQTLCRSFFQRYIRPHDTVLDVGAGFCEFINNIHCGRRLAVDTSEDVRRHAAPGVEVVLCRADRMAAIGDDSVDVAFASNFFEHLPSKDELLATLVEIRRVLRPGGRILVLQPNIRFTHGAYWDFFDHHLPLTDRSLVEALLLTGLLPVEVRARFLPYTTKSRLPKWSWLVRTYLSLPFLHRIFGQQAWIVAVKA